MWTWTTQKSMGEDACEMYYIIRWKRSGSTCYSTPTLRDSFNIINTLPEFINFCRNLEQLTSHLCFHSIVVSISHWQPMQGIRIHINWLIQFRKIDMFMVEIKLCSSCNLKNYFRISFPRICILSYHKKRRKITFTFYQIIVFTQIFIMKNIPHTCMWTFTYLKGSTGVFRD